MTIVGDVLPAMAAVGGLAGAGIQAAGALQQGDANSHAANYSAQVAYNNAIIDEQNAEYAIQSGVTKSADQSMKGAAVGGKIKAGLAANGVDVNTGSALDVQESQRETSKLDTETTMNNAELQAYGYRAKESGDIAQSQLDRAQADQAKTAGEISAAGGLLSNASAIGLKANFGSMFGNGPFSSADASLTGV